MHGLSGGGGGDKLDVPAKLVNKKQRASLVYAELVHALIAHMLLLSQSLRSEGTDPLSVAWSLLSPSFKALRCFFFLLLCGPFFSGEFICDG